MHENAQKFRSEKLRVQFPVTTHVWLLHDDNCKKWRKRKGEKETKKTNSLKT